jgi:hypothetical protein
LGFLILKAIREKDTNLFLLIKAINLLVNSLAYYSVAKAQKRPNKIDRS